MKKGTISVRLEGGIGDHILGMRLLYFICRRYPRHKIIGYSDAAGSLPQLEVARMSPFLSEIIPVYHKKRFPKIAAWGRLENIGKRYLNTMISSEFFFDTWGETFFIRQSRILGVPFYEIMARPPELIVPEDARNRASDILRHHKGRTFVGLNISEHDFGFLHKNRDVIIKFIKGLLKNPRVVILNFYVSKYKFSHWPKALGIAREEGAERESLRIGGLWSIDRRVIPMVDLPLPMVAALLKRCGYFIGVDNGIKHLAWALRVPRTFFITDDYNALDLLRWVPDFHRSLSFTCDKEDLSRHIREASHYARRAR